MIDRRGWIAVLCALTVIILTVSAAYGGETVTVIKGVYVCMSYNAKQQQFVSDVFTVNAGGQGLSTAWSRFLQTKYHMQDRVTCRRAGGPNMTESEARWTGTRAQNVFFRATDLIQAPTWAENELSSAWTARVKETHPDAQVNGGGCLIEQAEDAAARKKLLEAIDQERAGPESGWERIIVPFSFTPSGKAPE